MKTKNVLVSCLLFVLLVGLPRQSYADATCDVEMVDDAWLRFVHEITWSPTDNYGIISAVDGLWVVDLDALIVHPLYILQLKHVVRVAFTPDGEQLAVGLQTGEIYILNTSNWLITAELDDHDIRIVGLHYSPEGDTLVTLDEDGKFVSYDRDYNIISIWQSELIDINELEFSDDGAYLSPILPFDNGLVRVWDTYTGEQVYFWRLAPPRDHTKVHFVPGRYDIVVVHYSGETSLWPFPYEEKQVLDTRPDIDLDINPQGLMALFDKEGYVTLRTLDDDVITRWQVSEYPATGWIAPNGAYLASLDIVGHLKIWQLCEGVG